MAIELDELLVPNVKAWEKWLAKNHDKSIGVWLILHKKGGSVTELVYQEALRVALCYGWIDGQAGSVDEHTYKQRYTPRRAKSVWSARNVKLVGELTAEGLMKPAGQFAVDAAKADGRWERAYEGQANAVVPDDFAAAIAANENAAANFATISSANRYAFIYRINEAKREATRLARIEKFIDMLSRGETLH